MPAPQINWTARPPAAGVRVDPSGVQDASTSFQQVLLPGLSTVTLNVRYLSLFISARYHRIRAAKADHTLSERGSWPAFIRRLEAAIAVSSVLHHRDGSARPGG